MGAAKPFRESNEAVRTLQVDFQWSDATSTACWCNYASLSLGLPLSPEAAGDLEELLRERLRLPEGHTVFTARRLDEPFAPSLPLLLIHGLAPPDETALQLTVVVRPFMQLMLPPAKLELPSIPLSALEPGAAGSAGAVAEFLRRLQTFGTVRLRADQALAEATCGTLPSSVRPSDYRSPPPLEFGHVDRVCRRPRPQLHTRRCRRSLPSRRRRSNVCTPHVAAASCWQMGRPTLGATAVTPAGVRTRGASGSSCDSTCPGRARMRGGLRWPRAAWPHYRTGHPKRSLTSLASYDARPPSALGHLRAVVEWTRPLGCA